VDPLTLIWSGFVCKRQTRFGRQERAFKMAVFNIASLPKNLDESLILHDKKIDILAFNGTRLDFSI
jgi:hypothetical protein